MQVAKFDPFRELEGRFDRYGRTLGFARRGSQEAMASGDWTPRVDIAGTDKEFIIHAQIPGVGKEDVKVTVDSGVLTLKAERRQEKEEKNKKFHRVDRLCGSFARSFTLPDNVDESKIAAACKDGVLKLTIPKNTETKTNAIEVKGS